MSNISLVIASLISLSMASLGFIALRKNSKTITNRLFFIFTITVSSWCMFSFLENWFSSLRLAALFLRLDLFTALLGVFFAFLFLFNFPKPNKRFNFIAVWLSLPTIIVSLISLTDGVAKNIVIYNDRIGFDSGNYFFLYAGMMLAYILVGIFFQIKQYRESVGVSRIQTRYVLLGFSISSSIIIVLNLFLQNVVSKNIFVFGNFSLLFLVFFIFYAMARYHLMDIWVVLRLGMIFTLSLSSIIFFFTSVNYLLVSFLQIGEPWNIVIPSFFITLGFMPLKKSIEFITDEMFFRRHYKFNDVVQKIEKEIHAAGLDLDQSLSVVNQSISDALRVDRGAIMILIPRGHFISRQVIGDQINNLEFKHNNPIISYLNSFPGQVLDLEDIERNSDINGLIDDSRQKIMAEMKKIGISLVVPIEFQNKLIGVYLLGAKMSEDPFNSEDLKLLQHVVWEMSFAINNARSYEELKYLDEAKSNFIQVVSHQMRTPVAITRCNLELALDKNLNPEERESVLRSAYDGVSSLNRQLDQLLVVLEIEKKEMAIKKEPVDLNVLIAGLIEDNQVSINNKKIKLETNLLVPDLSVVECDKNRIIRVLDIILSNAINYTPNGGKIIIAINNDGFNGKNSLVVSMADNGVGINDNDKASLFKKFFRSPEAISMFPNGFGLGLFIARKIIQAHGGDIWFDGREGKGTVFYFSLPLKAAKDKK